MAKLNRKQKTVALRDSDLIARLCEQARQNRRNPIQEMRLILDQALPAFEKKLTQAGG